MRGPVASNLMVKTLARVEWYLEEIVPHFLLGTVIMFLLAKTGVLTSLTNIETPLVPGRLVQVLQQEPVTVVRADHTELALEGDLASKVLVEVVTP